LFDSVVICLQYHPLGAISSNGSQGWCKRGLNCIEGL
jgi:hypothetical protein